MADETHKGSGLRWAILFAVLLPIVYVLSLGPFAVVVKTTGNGRGAAQTAYAPLMWLCEAIPPLQVPLIWYERLWTDWIR
jgi:hypothetical protein